MLNIKVHTVTTRRKTDTETKKKTLRFSFNWLSYRPRRENKNVHAYTLLNAYESNRLTSKG